MLALLLTGLAVIAATDESNYLYKWYDDKGTLYITDRLADVPQPIRNVYTKNVVKAKEQSESGTRAANLQPGEYEMRSAADALRVKLHAHRRRLEALGEEQQVLLANSPMNDAQTSRRKRILQIDEEMDAHAESIREMLTRLRGLMADATKRGLPEAWVTGL